MVLCALLPSIWYATWLISEKDIVWHFDPPPPWVEGKSVGKIFATMLLPDSSALIWYAKRLLSEKYIVYIVWPFDPTPWVKGVSVGKLFATMLLPASSALFWYVAWPYSEKSLISASAPPPKSTQRTRTQAFKLQSPLICFISFAALPACKISAKYINNCLSYCEIKIFDLWSNDPWGGVKGVG